MADIIGKEVDENVQNISKDFFARLNSDMHFKSNIKGDAIDFEWLDVVENACPYIDNVVRNPKLILVNEAEVELIEKAKKINVESIRDLAIHTYNINDIDKNGDVRPNKILNIRSEETYNIYENRFLYTTIFLLTRFVLKKEKELDELLIDRNRKMEYAGRTKIGKENVEIKMQIKAEDSSRLSPDKKLLEEIEKIRTRIRRVKDYISGWQRSELIRALEKAKIKLVNPPIKKTNIILKNPNFQEAVKLWTFLYNYEEKSGDNKDGLDSDGNDILISLLDHAYLVNYYVMDSVCKTKKDSKEKISEVALALIKDELKRIIELLRKCGFKITDDEILDLIAEQMAYSKESGSKSSIAKDDIKNKFKESMGSYLERIQDYL